MGRSLAPPARASANCPSCGLANADAGDGFCAECGSRLGVSMLPPAIPIGATVAGYTVVGMHGEDFVVRSRAGESFLLVLGSAPLLALEAEALDRLADSAVARVVESGQDAARGAFLVLSLPAANALPLDDVARSIRVTGVVSLLRHVVDLAERVAAAGFHWLPLAEDVYVIRGGALGLARARCVARAPSAATDVRPALDAVAPLLLPYPAALGPVALARLLGSVRIPASPELVRGALGSIERDLADPPSESPFAASAETDRGFRRERNEDAIAVAGGEHARGPSSPPERWAALVVCDGVASSVDAGRAASLAAETTRDTLVKLVRSGEVLFDGLEAAMSRAIRAAHVALCALPRMHGAAVEPPGTTVVAALVLGRSLVVGWVGDSRAYWVSSAGVGELLTRDHSWAGETVIRGELTEAQAMASPLAHTLTRCLGPLEPSEDPTEDATPDLCARELDDAGHLVLCTDGLWNYFPTAQDIAGILRGAPPGAPTPILARACVNHALARGGGDNVSVAVYAHREPGPPRERRPATVTLTHRVGSGSEPS